MRTANEDTAAIRKELRKRGFTGSVRHGRGTAYGWVEIRGSEDGGVFTERERAVLSAEGLAGGGNFCVIAPEARAVWVARLEGRAPDPADVAHMRQMQEARMND